MSLEQKSPLSNLDKLSQLPSTYLTGQLKNSFAAKMLHQTFPNILLAALLLLLQIHASSALTLPLDNTPSNSALLAQQSAACYPPSTFDSHHADTKSCLQAAISLPEGADPGTFHGGGNDDGFKLPKVKVHGQCMATVSIRNSKTDRSTWDHIAFMASQIAAICSNGQYPRGTTGGVKYAGVGGNIRITLEKVAGVFLGEVDGGNATATSFLADT